MEARSDRQQTSFGRGLDVLIAVARNGQSSVAGLAEELGIPASTVYRYIRSLRDYALIEEAQGTYVPGWRLMEIAGQHLTHTTLVELGSQHLLALTYQSSETSAIAVRAGSQAIRLRQVVSTAPGHHVFRVNELLPLDSGAGELVLLAYAPEPIIDMVLAGRGPHTNSAREAVSELLAGARRTGYIHASRESADDPVAIAVPVFADGGVACSLTLAGPQERCSSERWFRRSLRSLQEAAAELGESLEK